jgi:DNA-binding transcriptional regulator of glucitol operon
MEMGMILVLFFVVLLIVFLVLFWFMNAYNRKLHEIENNGGIP